MFFILDKVICVVYFNYCIFYSRYKKSLMHSQSHFTRVVTNITERCTKKVVCQNLYASKQLDRIYIFRLRKKCQLQMCWKQLVCHTLMGNPVLLILWHNLEYIEDDQNELELWLNDGNDFVLGGWFLVKHSILSQSMCHIHK